MLRILTGIVLGKWEHIFAPASRSEVVLVEALVIFDDLNLDNILMTSSGRVHANNFVDTSSQSL